jgi:hypothetical protein
MGLIDRFTRDGASKIVWATCMVAAIAGLVYAMIHGDAVVAQERAAAQARAVAYVDRAVDPRVDSPSTPITGAEESSLRLALQRDVLGDPRVVRVRVWSVNGMLLFSTESADRVGSNEGLNDQLLDRVASGDTFTGSDISDTGGASDPERSLLRSYVPIGSSVVAEVDQSDAGTVAIARTEWRSYQILAGGLVVLFLVITALALRDPVEPINTGVPFAASSIPEGYSLIDDERLHAVNDVYRLSNERVANLQAKLTESEEIRRNLEGDVQQALARASTPGSRPVNVAKAPPPEDAPAVEPAPEAPPPVVRVPESDVVQPKPLGDAWVAAAAAGPLARANRDQKPAPAAAKQKAAAAPKAKREPRRLRKEKKVEASAPVAKAAPVAAPTQPKKTAPPATKAPTPQVAPKPTPAPEPASRSTRRDRKVAAVAAASAASSAAPAPAPPRPASPADREAQDAAAHEAALETFIRLTESDRQPHEAADVDQGAIRAALARTAARKKPGGERLQPHDEPESEPPGGTRRG